MKRPKRSVGRWGVYFYYPELKALKPLVAQLAFEDKLTVETVKEFVRALENARREWNAR